MEEQRCYQCMHLKEGAVCRHCGSRYTRQNEPHQLAAGTVLNEQYLIGLIIGQGGFGITYIGWDLYRDRRIAVKEYFPKSIAERDGDGSVKLTSQRKDEKEQFENTKKRFVREAEILAGLSDIPEIVQVNGCFFANHTAYLVMEYVEGITLKQYVKEQGGKLSDTQTFHLLQPVMRALNKIHEFGIVHRDVSPDNIMILPQGQIKLLDFGAVKYIENARTDKELTKPTEAILKEGYAPIEQYQTKGSLGPWTDVYALCAVMYYCMTGEVPPDALERLLGKEEISFIRHGAQIDRRKEQILCHGMTLRSKDRTSSIAQLYEELFGIPVKTVIKTESCTPPKKRLFYFAAAVAVCFVLCIGIVIGGNFDWEVQGRAAATHKEKMYSGKCGEDVYWKFQPHTKTLTLSGTGETYYYCQEDEERRQSLLSDEIVTEEWIHEGHAEFYQYADQIEKIVIEDGITAINQDIFADLPRLKDVDFGKIEALARRGGSCFERSSLKEAYLPDTLTDIDEWAFAFCEQLETVSVPDNVVRVGAHCFAGSSNLKTVTFGKNVVLEGNLLTGDTGEDHPYSVDVVYCGYDGSSAQRNAWEYGIVFKSIGLSENPSGFCGENVWWEFEADSRTLTLSGTGKLYYYLGLCADPEWDKKNLKKQNVPKRYIIEETPPWYRYRNLIETLVIEEGITILTQDAFRELVHLRTVDFGTVKKIEMNCFDSCASLKKIVLPDSVERIDSCAFNNCTGLESMVIINGADRIEGDV